MDATPPEPNDPRQAAQVERARRIIFGTMALMIGVLVLLFLLFPA